MSHQRDIERTLEAWFLDGPSVMPDRVFGAVLDRVERVPQRRLARLYLRLTEMYPRIRLFTVLAAALLVVVAALAIVGGGTQSPVKTSPSANPTVSAAPTDGAPVPAALQGKWMGDPGALVGLEADAGMTAVFTGESSFWMTQSNLRNQLRLPSRAVTLDGTRLMLTSRPDDPDCGDGDIGIYTWTLSPSGQTLTLAGETDACPARLGALPGTWELMDCPTADDNCLGKLDAGTHSSQFVDPFLRNGQAWRPRYGALTYTVPDGWENVSDWPGFFQLKPSSAPEGTWIYMATDVVLVSESDLCKDMPDPSLGTTAQAMATAIANGPGLITSRPTPVTIGGLDGYRLDISMDPAWTNECPWSGGERVRPIFTDRPADDGFNWPIGPGVQVRIYLLDVSADRAIFVDIESLTIADYEAFADEATTVIESFEITR
jgi:hypothetical protein